MKTKDAGDISNLCELQEPLVIHAPSDVEDSTPPVAVEGMFWWPEGGGQWESSARLGEVNGVLSADVRTPAFAWKASPRVQRGQRLLFPKAFLCTTAAGSFTSTIVSTTIQEPIVRTRSHSLCRSMKSFCVFVVMLLIANEHFCDRQYCS